jgi:1,4-dihydroxy-2-naphthoyl-CoA hydrolase
MDREKRLSILQSITRNMLEHLDIAFTDSGPGTISASMPVDKRTTQPFGVLHGGASVVLAETLGSAGSMLEIDTEKQYCAGLEINANHVRAVRSGYVHGTAKAIHLGRSTHIWETRIVDDNDRLVSIGRITMAVLDKAE